MIDLPNRASIGARLRYPDAGPHETAFVVATTRKFAEANPAIVRTFRKAHRSVLDYRQAHPDEVVAMTAAKTGLSEATVRDMVPMYDFGTEVTAADVAARTATDYFMLANGMIDKAVDVKRLILPAE